MKVVKKRIEGFSITSNLGYNRWNGKKMSNHAKDVLPATREIKGG